MRWLALRALLAGVVLVLLFALFNPPTTLTIIQNARDYPIAERRWRDLGEISPVMLRSVVAAEDANFCRHWGFDMEEIRRVVAAGRGGGASTLSQQVVKNVYLWQGRSWTRKAFEAVLTPMIEAVWTKRRILEVYLNVAEFGPGVFGIDAAARHHFGTTPDRLDYVQAARLAAILPAPKSRSTHSASRRSRAIADGAATIEKDGRADCFE
ncbi:monofunctional biosynthetic peptidoglycan transglycosylase [Paracoccus isoporae]|uniref:Biosynthetic peptidoglycan transglycosylase n=1 Tax=Paracoccus isoporae TaxID=591205 RepID=A0A1G6V3G0_9RHOB|nr:monofunctional biosynthetic peptidoglycan transglycosylase [Paracoccus isoporae]